MAGEKSCEKDVGENLTRIRKIFEILLNLSEKIVSEPFKNG